MNRRNYTSLVGLLGILIASCVPGGDGDNQASADLILSGAKIFTSNKQQPWAEAVAIKNGRFIYVGDSSGASRFRSDSTRSIDLGGRLVIPGLVDAHAHPGYIEVEQYGAISETSEEEMLAAVKKYAEEHPDDEWLRLCCWPIDLYVHGNQGPIRQTLDAVVPDRPLWFVSEWWHSGWLNSKALEVLGVDENTPDPAPGIGMYARDENGVPTGWVKEGAGWQHFTEQFEINESAHKLLHEQSMVAGLQLLSESGVTTLYDAGNFGFEDLIYGFMAKLEQEGNLPVRYEGTYQIFSPDRVQFAIPEMNRYRKEYGGERLQFNTIKLFMDGVNQNRAGGMLEPYADDPGFVGNTMLTAEELRDFLLELDEEHFDIHIHTMSDLAVRVVLDAVEAAKDIANESFYPRVTIAHLQIINSVDLPRIKDLGVVANFTPWWFAGVPADPLKISFGDDRYGKMYMAKSLIESGVTVTFSSDEWWGGELLWSYLNPFFGMQIGHTRQYPSEWREEGDEEIHPPENERLSVEQMIVGYTQNGAHQLRMENDIGSIETGKLADLVVLDGNLFDIDSDEIWKVKPAAVLMEGEVIQGQLPAGNHN
jgi:hypothetical protein